MSNDLLLLVLGAGAAYVILKDRKVPAPPVFRALAPLETLPPIPKGAPRIPISPAPYPEPPPTKYPVLENVADPFPVFQVPAPPPAEPIVYPGPPDAMERRSFPPGACLPEDQEILPCPPGQVPGRMALVRVHCPPGYKRDPSYNSVKCRDPDDWKDR